MKPKAKLSLSALTLFILVAVIVVSVVKSNDYDSPTISDVTVKSLQARLASSSSTVSPAKKSSVASSNQNAKTKQTGASVTKSSKLSNTGPGNVVLLFIATWFIFSGAHFAWRRMVLANSSI